MAACHLSCLCSHGQTCSTPNFKPFSITPSQSFPSLGFHRFRLTSSNYASLPTTITTTTTFAKFDGFEEDSSSASNIEQQSQVVPEEEEEEDDSCLPSDLEGAVRQSGEAAALFVSSGGMRAIVELLIPQLQFLDDEGAQAELWELSRVFIDTLIEETGSQRVKAVFPDAGAAALLKYRWKDANFGFSSLSDRKPVEAEDEIVVMVVPDYQMLGYVEKIASNLSDDTASSGSANAQVLNGFGIGEILESPRPLLMWNPRLVSEDVGVGFNVRKLRRYFLRSFTTVYSMRPLPSGAVFRCYPGLWKVFYDDKDRPNRYKLAKEQISRPDSEELDMIFGNVEENSESGQSFFGSAAGIFSSLSRFLRVISK